MSVSSSGRRTPEVRRVANNHRDRGRCVYCGGIWGVQRVGRSKLPACEMCRAAWQRQSVGRREWPTVRRRTLAAALVFVLALLGGVAARLRGGEVRGE